MICEPCRGTGGFERVDGSTFPCPRCEGSGCCGEQERTGFVDHESVKTVTELQTEMRARIAELRALRRMLRLAEAAADVRKTRRLRESASQGTS